MSGSSGPLARLRRPEYTGANRCWPCTAVNLSVAALACANVYIWGAMLASATVGVAAALAVAATSLAMVWLRGYLLPGTPVLTRHLPAAFLGLFGKDATPTVARGVTGHDGASGAETDGGAVSAAESTGIAVLDDTAVATNDGVADDFRRDWDRAVAETERVDAAALADRFGLPAGTAVGEVGRGVLARADGDRVGAWPSRLAFRADVASAGLLADRIDEWDALAPTERGCLCAALRAHRETCPACGASLSTGPATVRSCCGHLDVVATDCADCGTRLVERAADE